ncbi:MAG: ECF transporter S component [Defluviitaleaceae bacterium]|nr:ECF transporter S component [Defluviitaleaceae bacterium]
MMTTKSRTYDMVMIALLTAITYVATRFIHIPVPTSVTTGGLMHLGNIVIVVSAIVFGKKKAAVSAAFGMALFNLTSPFVIWAPFTFVIRGMQGYAIGHISHMKDNGSNTFFNIAAVTAGGVIQIAGYYLAEVAIYGNWITPLLSIPGDMAQIAAAFAGLPLAMLLKRAVKV